MRIGWRPLAWILVLSLMPGAAEAVENAVHLATEGHLAHADEHQPGDSHQPADGEHGCNSVFHLCACHASVSFVLNRVPSFDRAPLLVGVGEASPHHERPISEAVPTGLLRPPIS